MGWFLFLLTGCFFRLSVNLSNLPSVCFVFALYSEVIASFGFSYCRMPSLQACLEIIVLLLHFHECSTSLPGGNQVDGLPPASSQSAALPRNEVPGHLR